jgi:molybdopterin-guanine dinucleotide biosynthesis protein A
MRAIGIVLAGGNSKRMKELSEKRGSLCNADRRQLPQH